MKNNQIDDSLLSFKCNQIENFIRDFIKQETGVEFMSKFEFMKMNKNITLFDDMEISDEECGALKILFHRIKLKVYAKLFVRDGVVLCEFMLRYNFKQSKHSPSSWFVSAVTDGERLIDNRTRIERMIDARAKLKHHDSLQS